MTNPLSRLVGRAGAVDWILWTQIDIIQLNIYIMYNHYNVVLLLSPVCIPCLLSVWLYMYCIFKSDREPGLNVLLVLIIAIFFFATIKMIYISYYFSLIYAEIKTLEHDRKWKKMVTVM